MCLSDKVRSEGINFKCGDDVVGNAKADIQLIKAHAVDAQGVILISGARVLGQNFLYQHRQFRMLKTVDGQIGQRLFAPAYA